MAELNDKRSIVEGRRWRLFNLVTTKMMKDDSKGDTATTASALTTRIGKSPFLEPQWCNKIYHLAIPMALFIRCLPCPQSQHNRIGRKLFNLITSIRPKVSCLKAVCLTGPSQAVRRKGGRVARSSTALESYQFVLFALIHSFVGWYTRECECGRCALVHPIFDSLIYHRAFRAEESGSEHDVARSLGTMTTGQANFLTPTPRDPMHPQRASEPTKKPTSREQHAIL